MSDIGLSSSITMPADKAASLIERSDEEQDAGARNTEADAFSSSVGLLDLSKQQRNLLLLRPLFQLELNKHRIGVEAGASSTLFAGIDTHYLALSALDFMMESTTLNNGCTQSEVLQHLAAIAFEMNRQLTPQQAIRVAEVLLDTLDNKTNACREFSFEFFDAAQKMNKNVRFRLVSYEPDLDDTYRYKPTPEGYLVYLGMLDLSPEDSQEVMEKMLDLLVKRGRFEAALEIAKRARTLSIGYRQLIRDRLLQAYRAPGSVNWTKEMSGKLNDARKHVSARQSEDQRMEEAIRDGLLITEEPKTRQDMVQLLKAIQGAGLIRSNLVNDISVAPEKFLDAQKAVFRARSPSGMPDLESRLLPQILGLPLGTLIEQADFGVSSFYPPVWPKVYDLNSAFALLLERRAEKVEAEVDDGEITPFVPEKERFSNELISTVEGWLKAQFSTGRSFHLDELLQLSEEAGLSRQMRRCLVLMLFRSFAQSESIFPQMHSEVDGQFVLDIAQGSNLMFFPKEKE